MSDLLRHLTISRDQTSASRIVEDRLVALAKTTDYVIVRPKGPVVEINEGTKDRLAPLVETNEGIRGLNGPGSAPNEHTIFDHAMVR